MFTLLPRTGLDLPDGLGTLRFGMSAHEAERLVARLADIRSGWACGVGWTFSADHRGIELTVSGDLIDHDQDSGLAIITLDRHGDLVPRAPSEVPVVWNDIDLFGYPAQEVDDVLEELFPRVARPSGGRFDPLPEKFGLSLDYSGRRTPTIPSGAANAANGHLPWHQHVPQRPAAPHYVASARLVHPERWP